LTNSLIMSLMIASLGSGSGGGGGGAGRTGLVWEWLQNFSE
jgi:hypothetical protein